jgi:hypothetical protein
MSRQRRLNNLFQSSLTRRPPFIPAFRGLKPTAKISHRYAMGIKYFNAILANEVGDSTPLRRPACKRMVNVETKHKAIEDSDSLL